MDFQFVVDELFDCLKLKLRPSDFKVLDCPDKNVITSLQASFTEDDRKFTIIIQESKKE